MEFINKIFKYGGALFLVGAIFLSFYPVYPTSIQATYAGYAASDILGQPDDSGVPNFTKSLTNGSDGTNGFNFPGATAVDEVHHRVFVTDSLNNRVLVYDLDSSNDLVDHTADKVLGQSSFTTINFGTTASLFNYPYGVEYDATNDRLFVSDNSNNRILVFDTAAITNGEAAVNVLGQATFTSSTSATSQTRTFGPAHMAYDDAGGRLFVADQFNNRVLVYDVASITDGEAAINVFGQALFTTNTATTTATGLRSPSSVALDSAGNRLFVADTTNHRVVQYDITAITDGEAAVKVLGQSLFTTNTGTTTQTGLKSPSGIAYDSDNSRLIVADGGNRRVVTYDVTAITDGEAAVNVLGQALFTTSTVLTAQNGLAGANELSYVESTGDLYVVDANSQRVIVFNITAITDGENAVNLLGQTDADGNLDYTSYIQDNFGNIGDIGFYYPEDVLVDTVHHRVFVADNSNARVLVFNLDSDNNFEDKVADNVLGAPDFTTLSYTASEVSLSSAQGLAYDATGDRLFVSDSSSNRILVFDVAVITDGEAAINVLGQADFTATSGATSATGLRSPQYMSYDDVDNRLFVADYINSRVVVYDVTAITDGEAAVNVLGQALFTTSTAATSQTGLRSPESVRYDSANNRLFVSDTSNNRVVVYDTASITDNESMVGMVGQADYVTRTAVVGQMNFFGVYGIDFDESTNRLYTVTGSQSVQIFDFVRLDESLPSAITGSEYTQPLSITEEQGTVSVSATSGSLPTGVSLVGTSLTGTPTVAGVYTFTLQAIDTVDIGNFAGSQEYTITVNEPVPTSSGSASSEDARGLQIPSIQMPSSYTGGQTESPPLVPPTDIRGPFTRNLGYGSRGADVSLLQQFLNHKGFVLAQSGAGSPGNETQFFGPRTKNAVIRFQRAYYSTIGAVTGYFGPKTRALVNSIY
jgi:DNA-binding beta-propeller fold protein YncE